MASKAQVEQFEMKFDPMTIEHFGLRLYSHLPPVLNELVSNAFDADASKVEIVVPTGPISPTSEVKVRDFGHGMSAEELQTEYLVIGRPRRGSDGAVTMSKSGNRRVTGRKGLGKLSVFGVADLMELRSIKDGKAICLQFSFPGMREWASNRGSTPYQPALVASRSGPTSERSGVEVLLRKLRRSTPIDPDEVRRGLAKRLTIFGSSFQVLVNGTPIGPGDRLSREDCAEAQCWDVASFGQELEMVNAPSVSGWIGFLEESSQRHRGVDIFATGKAVELGSYFNYASTHAQFARAHLVGEVHADFLDAQQDLVSTARNSVVWESPEGEQLERWGQAVLKHLFDQWIRLRRKAKEEEVIKAGKFDVWLSTRTAGERRVAARMLKVLAADDSMEPASLIPILEIVKGSVESVAFNELVDKIEESGSSLKTLLELFSEWRVIEAREHLKLADGRFEAIERLHHYMQEGALEVQQIQPLFEQNLWMLDNSWTEAAGQTTYTQLLREKCKEPKDTPDEDRRLDIMGVSAGGSLTIVELKRPTKTLSRADLEQIEKYVDWAMSNIVGTGDDAPKSVRGLLIVGKQNAEHKLKVQRLAGDGILVQTFADLYTRCKAQLKHTDKVFRKVAPEYSATARKAKKGVAAVTVVAAAGRPVVAGAKRAQET